MLGISYIDRIRNYAMRKDQRRDRWKTIRIRRRKSKCSSHVKSANSISATSYTVPPKVKEAAGRWTNNVTEWTGRSFTKADIGIQPKHVERTAQVLWCAATLLQSYGTDFDVDDGYTYKKI